MGLKIESNTRRFVVDDSKEIHYRVEVQNRVYKKEITALDAEIQKLEKMLEHSSTSSSTASVAHHMKASPSKNYQVKNTENINLASPFKVKQNFNHTNIFRELFSTESRVLLV